MAEILNAYGRHQDISLVEFGCGNGQLYETLTEKKVQCSYAGVDFSHALLKAGRQAHKNDPKVSFILDDVMELSNLTGRFDFGIYSHVIEMLSSPELSLRNARKFCDKIIIRFFEPPDFEWDTVDLLEMNVGKGKPVPYLRRKMSKDYYRLILSKIACRQVDIYRAPDKDQVHVLHF